MVIGTCVNVKQLNSTNALKDSIFRPRSRLIQSSSLYRYNYQGLDLPQVCFNRPSDCSIYGSSWLLHSNTPCENERRTTFNQGALGGTFREQSFLILVTGAEDFWQGMKLLSTIWWEYENSKSSFYGVQNYFA